MRTFRFSLIAAGLFAGFMSLGLSAANSDPPPARVVIDSQIRNALAVLRDAKLTPAEKRDKIGQIADEHTDFETLSKLTLGRYWRDLTPDQRSAFVEAFKQHLANTYGNLLNGYTDQNLQVADDHRESDGDWTVQLRVTDGTSQELAKVYCRLRRKTEWKVIDVTVMGVSLATLFRAQFQDIMAHGGFDRLIKLLRDKVGQQGGKGSDTRQKQTRSWGGHPVGVCV